MFSIIESSNWYMALVSELLYLRKSKLYPDLHDLPNHKMWFKGVADRVEAAFGVLEDTKENRQRLRHLFLGVSVPLVDAALRDLLPGVDL